MTVFPKKSVRINDEEAYGAIVIQGHGKYGELSVNSPAMIRFGQMTEDELFVTKEAAKNGVTVTNNSDYDDLVILKHIGPTP